LLNKFSEWSFSMPNFESFIARHGEFGVQAIIERIERYEGVAAFIGTSLEERWYRVMRLEADCHSVAAA
jgi:hypothetical protein